MKSIRPLVVGIVLATLGVIAYTTWQWVRVRVGGPAVPPATGEARRTPYGDKLVSQTDDSENLGRSHAEKLRRMVEQQLQARDITDRRVLEAMQEVPRHLFVPEREVDQAYWDGPLPIGHGQTISQPYIVGLMTQLACPSDSSVALDVGTGSGYQAAVLSRLCKRVYSIEIVEPLADSARARLERLGYKNVTVRAGDGYGGWPEHAPFDLIIVAAAPEQVPQPLIDQLKPGGRLVIPVGRYYQSLIVVHKEADGTVRRQQVIPVAFVPMTGQAQKAGQ